MDFHGVSQHLSAFHLSNIRRSLLPVGFTNLRMTKFELAFFQLESLTTQPRDNVVGWANGPHQRVTTSITTDHRAPKFGR